MKARGRDREAVNWNRKCIVLFSRSIKASVETRGRESAVEIPLLLTNF